MDRAINWEGRRGQLALQGVVPSVIEQIIAAEQLAQHSATPAAAVTPAEPVPMADAKATKATQAAERTARQDGRLRECEAAGLIFDKASANSLPYGVGKEAKKLNITRQSLSADIKAALQRRYDSARNGKG